MRKKAINTFWKITMHLLGAIVTALGLGGILILGLFM